MSEEFELEADFDFDEDLENDLIGYDDEYDEALVEFDEFDSNLKTSPCVQRSCKRKI